MGANTKRDATEARVGRPLRDRRSYWLLLVVASAGDGDDGDDGDGGGGGGACIN